MATYKTPGVYVEEISKLPPSVAEVSTAIPAFIGCTQNGPAAGAAPVVKRIDTMLDFQTLFGGPFINSFEVALTDDKTAMKSITRTTPTFDPLLYYGVSMYFANGGGSCYIVSIGVYDAKPTAQNFLDGLAALEDNQRRDGADLELLAYLAVVVGIELADLDPAVVFLGQFVDDGGDHAAGHAPLGPEIHQHRQGRLDDLGLKIRIRELNEFFRCHGLVVLSLKSFSVTDWNITDSVQESTRDSNGPRQFPCPRIPV